MPHLTGIHIITGWLAGVMTLVAFTPYVRSILLGKTRPNRVSWFIWAFICTITAFAYRASGASATLWVAYVYAAMTTLVALLSIKRGEPGFTWLDCVCFFGAVASLVPWFVFHDAPLALYISIAIDVFAVLPTLHKAYRDPASEDPLAWTISATAMALNLFAIEDWSPRVSAYPIYCFIAVGSIAAVLHVRSAQNDPRIPGVRPDTA